MNKILVVAAHPDDDILGCGGMLSKYSKTKEFRVIYLAEGSSCRFSSLDESEELRRTIKQRNDFAIEALSTLGVSDYKFYGLPCGRLDTLPIIEINKIIENEINQYKPDTVLTHSEFDANNDHRIVNRSVIMATRPGTYKMLKKVAVFETQSSSEWNFTNVFLPNNFIALTEEDIEKKWKALSYFKTEVRQYPHPRSYEGLITLAKYRGMQVGTHFAESYQIIWSIE